MRLKALFSTAAACVAFSTIPTQSANAGFISDLYERLTQDRPRVERPQMERPRMERPMRPNGDRPQRPQRPNRPVARNVPEIDAAGAMLAFSLMGGMVAVVRERRRQRRK